MTFVSITNILLCLLCVGVLVQSARMLRNFRTMRDSDLGDSVKHLDRATDQAREVFSDLRRVLATEGQANARALASAEMLRDELSLMVGIGNAVAERLAEAAEAAKDARGDTAPGEKAAGTKPPTRTRAKRSRGSRQRAAKPVVAEEKNDAPALAAVPVQASASVSLLPHLSKAA